MKKILITTLLLVSTLLVINPIFAGELTVDTVGWTKEQVSQLFNASASLIGKAGFTIGTNAIRGEGSKVIVDEGKLNPAGFDINAFFSMQKIKDETDLIIADNLVAATALQQEKDAKKTVIKSALKIDETQLQTLIEFIKSEVAQ